MVDTTTATMLVAMLDEMLVTMLVTLLVTLSVTMFDSMLVTMLVTIFFTPTGGVSEVLDLANMTSSDTSAAEEWVGFFEMVEEAHGNNTIFIATKSTVS